MLDHSRQGASIVKRILIIVVAATLLFGVTPAGAHGPSVSVTYDEGRFLAAQPIVRTVTFEAYVDGKEFPPAQRTVNIRCARLRSLDTADPSWTIDGDPLDRSLGRTFAGTSGPDTADVGITFCRGKAVKAFGFRIDPIGGVFVIRVTETDGSITRIGPMELGTREETYFGLSSRKGIKRVVIAQRADLAGGFANFSLDDVSRSALLGR
jgi:hypothetical protein